MTGHSDERTANLINGTHDGAAVDGVALALAPPQETAPLANGTNGAEGGVNRHAEAGRKGGRRVHELIQRGRLYEQEHRLKGGRQRLRQLIEEGKLYEQEHSLAPERKARRPRVSSEQAVRRLLEAVLRLARPRYRPQLLALLRALEDQAA
jgi:hypothetical protein